MPDIPDLVWLFIWFASLVVLIIDHLHLRKVRREVAQVQSSVNQMLHRSATHQRSAGVGRTPPGATPQRDKAYALPRTDLPATGRQSQSMRFVMKGGDNDASDTPESRLRERGRRAPGTLRRRGGEAQAEVPEGR